MTREGQALEELQEARFLHQEDIRYRGELARDGKLTKTWELTLVLDVLNQQKRIRRAIAIIRRERRG